MQTIAFYVVKNSTMKKFKGESIMKEITKEMTVGEVIELNEGLKDVLMGFGMHCFGCPYSLGETLEEAAEVHEIDIDFLIKKLNEENK